MWYSAKKKMVEYQLEALREIGDNMEKDDWMYVK